MIVMSHKTLPDVQCFDGGQVEAAEAKGYSRKLNTPVKAVKAAKVEEVDTPEAAYERKFGKPPHWKMKLDNVIAALED